MVRKIFFIYDIVLVSKTHDGFMRNNCVGSKKAFLQENFTSIEEKTSEKHIFVVVLRRYNFLDDYVLNYALKGVGNH